MGKGVRGTREIGRDDPVLLELGLNEPDKARAKHSASSMDKFLLKTLDGGEGSFEGHSKVVGHGGGFGGNATEEEMMIVRHRCPVEYGGLAGFAGGCEGYRLGILVLEVISCDLC